MNKVSVFVSAVTKTEVECVKFIPAQTYNDGIVQGQDYVNENQISIQIINYCNVPFTISEMVLFSDNVNGGNFTAKIQPFTIQANQTLNVPVFYNGIYLGSNLTPSYSVIMNGAVNIFNLTVTVPIVNQPPVVSDIVFELDNREDYVFTEDDFNNHFTDLDGDDWDAVLFEGNVSQYRLNNLPYIIGTEVSKAQVIAGNLKRFAPDTDNYSEEATIWKAKDTAGNISL